MRGTVERRGREGVARRRCVFMLGDGGGRVKRAGRCRGASGGEGSGEVRWDGRAVQRHRQTHTRTRTHPCHAPLRSPRRPAGLRLRSERQK
ncbi:MAG: hypothetical protein ACKERG_00160 [Candidatus Hodgkinia cicadicola]